MQWLSSRLTWQQQEKEKEATWRQREAKIGSHLARNWIQGQRQQRSAEQTAGESEGRETGSVGSCREEGGGRATATLSRGWEALSPASNMHPVATSSDETSGGVEERGDSDPVQCCKVVHRKNKGTVTTVSRSSQGNWLVFCFCKTLSFIWENN